MTVTADVPARTITDHIIHLAVFLVYSAVRRLGRPDRRFRRRLLIRRGLYLGFCRLLHGFGLEPLKRDADRLHYPRIRINRALISKSVYVHTL